MCTLPHDPVVKFRHSGSSVISGFLNMTCTFTNSFKLPSDSEILWNKNHYKLDLLNFPHRFSNTNVNRDGIYSDCHCKIFSKE